MNFKKLRIFFLITLIIIGIGSGVFQYVKTFQAEIVSAYQNNKPAAGHSWTEMQCTSDLCITNNKVGVGTDSPSQKLEVNGSILATTDICNGSGACLSQIEDFIGAQPTAGGTDHTREMCTSAGGTLVDIGLANPLCRFDLSACPSEWHQYFNWGTQPVVTCTHAFNCSWCADSSCTIGPYPWGNNAIATCTYYTFLGACNSQSNCTLQNPATCTSYYTQVGCY